MRAVLFDLDGTLLDIDINAFLERYFRALSGAVAEIADGDDDVDRLMQAILASTEAMMQPHPGQTNRDAFSESFERLTDVPLEPHWHVFDRFYEEVFPGLGAGLGPSVGARAALDAAGECDLRIAIATNPIFPRRAIEHRLSWAGVSPAEVDLITSYEGMEACKPLPSYFMQTASLLGVAPHDCLMVGDDRVLDLAAADIGMQTFYVGSDDGVHADYRGSLVDLSDLLRRVCDVGPDVRD